MTSRKRRKVVPRPHPAPARRPPPGLSTWLVAGALVVVTAIAYSGSFRGVFVFDDRAAVAQNPNIRSLWPLGRALSAPEETTLSGRPVASLSFALTYALAPADARAALEEPAPGAPPSQSAAFYRNLWTYHAVNLLIHVLAALVLFGVVLRTLRSSGTPSTVQESALPVAGLVAILWAVHPLQTSSVTYVMQRVESLMGLFYLLTLYCAIRAWSAGSGRLWALASVVACALAMGTKEVAVTIPAMVVIWDWLFAADGAGARPPLRGLLGRRWPLYAGLAATWAILAVLVAGGPRERSVGFHFSEWPWTTYLLTQADVVVHYLRLAFVPRPLVLDYAWPPAVSLGSVWWQAALLAILLVAAAVGLVRRKRAAFPLAWFILILLPTSSVVPIATQPAAEHRMYLPLAGVIAAVSVAAFVTTQRLLQGRRSQVVRVAGVAASAAMILLLARMTDARNADYLGYRRIWLDTIQKRPENARARNNYATELLAEGRHDEAAEHLRAAVQLDPRSVEARANLGVSLCMARRFDEGISHLREAIGLDPGYVPAHRDLAEAYASTGQHALAVESYTRALELRPDDVFLLNRAAWLMATSTDARVRNGARSRAFAARAVSLTDRRDVTSLDTLAAAHAEAGEFDAAVAAALEARGLAAAAGQRAMIPELDERLTRYRARQPMREAPMAQDPTSR